MFLKLKILFALLLLTIGNCHRSTPLDDMYAICDTSYQTSELYFPEKRKLELNLRFVYFADSLNEEQINYDSVLLFINNFYKIADLKFRIYSIDTIVSPDIKADMPSYVKYHFKHFKVDSAITCYIFGDYQPNYPEDRKYTAGSAGGIGSKFFAIRKRFTNLVTINHEIGHCLSLKHTTEYDESNHGYTIYSGDNVCDTRYIENLPSKIDDKCNFVGSDKLTKEEKEMTICNFMSTSHLNCRNCIRDGQIRRIRFHIHESPDMRMVVYKGLNKDPLYQ